MCLLSHFFCVLVTILQSYIPYCIIFTVCLHRHENVTVKQEWPHTRRNPITHTPTSQSAKPYFDVILINQAYVGANSVLLYQHFLYVYINRLLLNYAESEINVFGRCSYVTTKPGSCQTPRRTRGF